MIPSRQREIVLDKFDDLGISVLEAMKSLISLFLNLFELFRMEEDYSSFYYLFIYLFIYLIIVISQNDIKLREYSAILCIRLYT